VVYVALASPFGSIVIFIATTVTVVKVPISTGFFGNGPCPVVLITVTPLSR
jgi:hypothetical protein